MQTAGLCGGGGYLSAPDFLDFRDSVTFGRLVAVLDYRPIGFDLTGDGAPLRVTALPVSAGFFNLLGARPRLGRGFTLQEESGARLAILSEDLWRQRFSGTPDVLGRSILLDAVPYVIVGVMPASLRGPTGVDPDLWVPLDLRPEGDNFGSSTTRANRHLSLVGRLRDGSAFAGSQDQLDRVAARLAEQHIENREGSSGRLVPLHDDLVGTSRPLLGVILGTAALVLLIACANIGNLLLIRGAHREGELAVRAALGSGRARLVRQLLTENVVLVVAGGTGGLLLAWAGVPALLAMAPRALPLTPTALASTPTSSSSPWDCRSPPCSLAVTLVHGAGLLTRSFSWLASLDLGFQTTGAIAVSVNLPDGRYGDPATRIAFYQRFYDGLSAEPGIESAGGISRLPASGSYHTWGFQIPGREDTANQGWGAANMRCVDGAYFDAMGIALRAGRFLDDRDRAESRSVVVVNERYAGLFFPDGDAIGSRVRVLAGGTASDVLRTIVGVVADTRQDHFEPPGAQGVHPAQSAGRQPELAPDARGAVQAPARDGCRIDRARARGHRSRIDRPRRAGTRGGGGRGHRA
jgi:hypothetical protein